MGQPRSWGHLGAINESTLKKHDCNKPVLGREIRTSDYLLNPDSLLLSGPSLRAVPWLRRRFGSRSYCYDREGPKTDIRTEGEDGGSDHNGFCTAFPHFFDQRLALEWGVQYRQEES